MPRSAAQLAPSGLAAALAAAAVLALPSAPLAEAGPERARAGRAAPARAGEVVRIERPRLFGRHGIRGCLSLSADQQHFTCFGGAQPIEGAVYDVVDHQGHVGVARVVSAEPSAQDQCRAGVTHDVRFVYEGGPPRSFVVQGYGPPVAVSGLDLAGTAARSMPGGVQHRSPSGREEHVWLALDRSGDGAVDFMATVAEGCPEATTSLPPAPPGQTANAMCLDYWVKADAEWTRVTRDPYYSCY
jgi:hypothetical protein